MSQALTPPPKGAMYLFDFITPALKPDSYRIHVSTDVTVPLDPATHTLDEDKYFDVVGPRFTLAATEVAGVFPPRNGHGPFQDGLAQVALNRRTLPWERAVDQNASDAIPPIPAPSDGLGLAFGYPTPWMALLLFEEGEYTLYPGIPLENVVPKSVFASLGSPANILCDAVEADLSLVKQIVPSKEELALLTHVRWVNIDDRELNVEGSDGWFAVVTTNRLPTPGAKCRACLVSLEERRDLVTRDSPATEDPVNLSAIEQNINAQYRDLVVATSENAFSVMEPFSRASAGRLKAPTPAKVRLVLLHSWQFVCEGTGTFFTLMQGLDVGMMGKVETLGQPSLTDTGHLTVPLHDRAGVAETSLYRGPLAPFELTRDPQGPYHSADQARRATPEAGVEDISYACAFETGRLLASSDARLAQELIRWRRESYRQAARTSTLSILQNQIQMAMPGTLEAQLQTPFSPVVAAASLGVMVAGSGPIADRYGLNATKNVVGRDPQALSAAWSISVPEATSVLGGQPGTLGVESPELPQTPRPAATLDIVAADTAGLQKLTNARLQTLANAAVLIGGSK
jgi:hypothetical protein